LKKHLAIVILIIILLALSIPFASNNPDGLEKLIESFGPAENSPFWSGIMPEYSISTISNQYVSALLAGFFGIIVVLLTTFLLGKAIPMKNPKISS